MSYTVSARAQNLFEVKKIDDCKEGDLIDWGTKLQVGCLYTFGECAQTMPEYYKYGWVLCQDAVHPPHSSK